LLAFAEQELEQYVLSNCLLQGMDASHTGQRLGLSMYLASFLAVRLLLLHASEQ
jgi:hypothetical protein